MCSNDFPSENARIQKKNGDIVGPYKMIFAGKTVIVEDEMADIQIGNILLRTLPNGNDEEKIITEVNFFNKSSGFGAHYQLKVAEKDINEIKKREQNITINNAQAVQIGDYNTQNIINSLEELKEKIASSNATQVEKDNAQSLLSKFCSNPLVCSILGTITKSFL